MMQGKKILYVHGFASSGASGTAKNLRILLPNATVISPDLPVSPLAAMKLLHEICDTEKPDLIIGTSMGGFYAEQLYGFDRILVNPAFQIGDTLKKLHGMGKQKWLNARQDGETEFWITQDTVDEFKDVMAQSFRASMLTKIASESMDFLATRTRWCIPLICLPRIISMRYILMANTA